MTFFTDPSYGPLLTFVLLSFLVSLGITIVAKYATNQRIMKQLREDIKKFQEQMKSTKDTKKQLELQKKAMDVNMKYMMQSMRPTLFTIIPILMVFGWVAANLSVQQIMPGEQFVVHVALEKGEASSVIPEFSDGVELISASFAGQVANYTLKASEGKHTLSFSFEDTLVQKSLLVTKKWDFEKPKIIKSNFLDGIFSGEIVSSSKIPSDSPFKSVIVSHKPVQPFGSFSIFGYMPGWVMTYILFSLVFSIAIRKILDVH
ncbi:MAG: EMC3/TMCO1 family protein [Nanoarchaeota archaeon]